MKFPRKRLSVICAILLESSEISLNFPTISVKKLSFHVGWQGSFGQFRVCPYQDRASIWCEFIDNFRWLLSSQAVACHSKGCWTRISLDLVHKSQCVCPLGGLKLYSTSQAYHKRSLHIHTSTWHLHIPGFPRIPPKLVLFPPSDNLMRFVSCDSSTTSATSCFAAIQRVPMLPPMVTSEVHVWSAWPQWPEHACAPGSKRPWAACRWKEASMDLKHLQNILIILKLNQTLLQTVYAKYPSASTYPNLEKKNILK